MIVVCQYSVSVDGPVTVTVSTCETIGLRKAEQKAEPSNLTDAGLQYCQAGYLILEQMKTYGLMILRPTTAYSPRPVHARIF